MRGKRKLLLLFLLTLTLALPAVAQQAGNFPLSLDRLDRLGEKAKEKVAVTLNRQLIEMALKFMPANDPETAKAKAAVQGLTGIYVRSFEFEKEGEYQMSDVEALRKQIEAPGWSRIVEVRGKDENVDVAMHLEGDRISGLIVIAAEPKELTIVNIAGTIRPEQLGELERFGVPNVGKLGQEKPESPATGRSKKAPAPPKKDE